MSLSGAAAGVEAGAQDGEQSEGAEEEAAFQRVRQGCGEQKPGILLQFPGKYCWSLSSIVA